MHRTTARRSRATLLTIMIAGLVLALGAGPASAAITAEVDGADTVSDGDTITVTGDFTSGRDGAQAMSVVACGNAVGGVAIPLADMDADTNDDDIPDRCWHPGETVF